MEYNWVYSAEMNLLLCLSLGFLAFIPVPEERIEELTV